MTAGNVADCQYLNSRSRSGSGAMWKTEASQQLSKFRQAFVLSLFSSAHHEMFSVAGMRVQAAASTLALQT